MDETSLSSGEGDLSAEDLAVLQAFHAMQDEQAEPPLAGTTKAAALPASQPPKSESQSSLFFSEDDMLLLFASEAAEDIASMRRALGQLEQAERVDSPGFVPLKQTAHKLKGTAGAIGCESMSSIARSIEMLIELVKGGEVVYRVGLLALVQAVQALEMTLQSVINNGQESKSPRIELEEHYEALNLPIPGAGAAGHVPPENVGVIYPPDRDSLVGTLSGRQVAQGPLVHIASKGMQETQRSKQSVSVDMHHLNQLMLHTERLIEQHTPLESAQNQVEAALSELQSAQARLRRLGNVYAPVSLPVVNTNGGMKDEHPTSSLVARILHEALQRTGHVHQSKRGSGRMPPRQGEGQPLPHTAGPAGSRLLVEALEMHNITLWDEMEIDRDTESSLLAHSLSEAIADIATASTQLRVALTYFNSLVNQHMAQATAVRDNTLLLQSAPFSTLITHLRRTVEMVAQSQKQEVQFEAAGETTEIDRDILEAITHPLVQLVRTGIAHNVFPTENRTDYPARIQLRAQALGNELRIEIGFSTAMPTGEGGAVESLQEAIQHVNGSISVQRNTIGGISLRLRFSHSQGIVQGLLVRVDEQSVIVPFSQVQYIDYNRQTRDVDLYKLNTLLGFSPSHHRHNSDPLQAVLILEHEMPRLAVGVDEIVGEVKLVMKPLAAHLRRPGIVATAIDGMGNVLLILDLPELIRQSDRAQQHQESAQPVSENVGVDRHPVWGTGNRGTFARPELPYTILIADDSVYIRQSLYQVLSHAGYTVLQARDGMEALERMGEQSPNLLLLDVEMPNLNGYDLLNIIRANPVLTRLKIILLTSRSSEKHKQRALELGADDFLTKPCPQELLLETIQSLLIKPVQ